MSETKVVTFALGTGPETKPRDPILETALSMLTTLTYEDLRRQYPERLGEWHEIGFEKRNEWRAWMRRYVEAFAERQAQEDAFLALPLGDIGFKPPSHYAEIMREHFEGKP